MSTDPSPELLAAFRLFVEQANWDVLRPLDKQRFHDFISRADRDGWEASGDEVYTMLLAAGAAYEESRRLSLMYGHGREALRQAGEGAREAALEQTLAPEWSSLGVPAAAPAPAPRRTKLRAAIIGCGAFSMGQNVPNCLRSELIDVTWVYDYLPEKAAAAAARFSPAPRVADSLEQLLADPELDLCICAVPHSEHERVVLAVAAAGKHIFTEKPMAMTMDEVYAIQKAIKQSGVKLCVDYNRGSSPAMRDFKAVYQAHRANPRIAPGQLVVADRPSLPEEEASTLLIRVQDESSTYGPVHLDWHTGGGEIIGETCHWLELTCWLFEESPVRIFATGSARMTHMITMDFASGRQAVIIFSVTGTFRYPKELYEITDHGALLRSLCFVENEYYGLAGVPSQRLFTLEADPRLRVTAPGHAGYVAACNARADQYAAHPEQGYLPITIDKGHFNLLNSFAEAILEDGPSPVDEKAGARATYLALRAIESLRTGHPVPINKEDMDMFVA
ncbi:MAG TPA: Gfo/Idh/MocA family oxidoreductase [Armatimonadota bacterium]|jgi:predicted dehydrogenase